MQGVKDIIAAIDSGDSQAIDTAFQSEMATRIASRLEDMRVNVAKSMFATEQQEQVEEEVEIFAEELEDEELATIIESLTDEDFEGLDEENTLELEEKYLGFAKLKGKLAHKAGVKNPGALAAAIGRKKYGKEKFQKAAAAGKKMHEEAEDIQEAGTITGKIVKGVARVGNELKDAGKGAAELGGQVVGTAAKTVGAIAALPGATKAAYQQGKANTYQSVAGK